MISLTPCLDTLSSSSFSVNDTLDTMGWLFSQYMKSSMSMVLMRLNSSVRIGRVNRKQADDVPG